MSVRNLAWVGWGGVGWDGVGWGGMGWGGVGWGGGFELELSSLSSGIQVVYFLIWRCLQVNSLLSRADGSQQKF